MLIPFELYVFVYFCTADTCTNGSSDTCGEKMSSGVCCPPGTLKRSDTSPNRFWIHCWFNTWGWGKRIFPFKHPWENQCRASIAKTKYWSYVLLLVFPILFFIHPMILVFFENLCSLICLSTWQFLLLLGFFSFLESNVWTSCWWGKCNRYENERLQNHMTEKKSMKGLN